ncbi:MAG: hypothetical protein V3R34_01730 [Hyphomicrobium sp.]
MKALSIHPEWAFAITHLGKRVENRSWRPPAADIGKCFAIHASRHFGGSPGEKRALRQIEALRSMAKRCGWTDKGFDETLAAAASASLSCSAQRFRGIPVGSIVATARLVSCRRPARIPEPWAFGPWCWILEDVRRLEEPIKCKGRQGLWSAAALADAIAEAKASPAGGAPR